jgi:hypothetical protein
LALPGGCLAGVRRDSKRGSSRGKRGTLCLDDAGSIPDRTTGIGIQGKNYGVDSDSGVKGFPPEPPFPKREWNGGANYIKLLKAPHTIDGSGVKGFPPNPPSKIKVEWLSLLSRIIEGSTYYTKEYDFLNGTDY